MDKELEDQFYEQVAREITANNYQPAPMARAVEKSAGNSDLAKSLYIKFRIEQLVREYDQEIRRRQHEAEQQAREQNRLHAIALEKQQQEALALNEKQRQEVLVLAKQRQEVLALAKQRQKALVLEKQRQEAIATMAMRPKLSQEVLRRKQASANMDAKLTAFFSALIVVLILIFLSYIFS